MFLRSYRRSVLVIIPAMAILLFASSVWIEQPLITPLPQTDFMCNVETTVPIFLIAVCSFLLHDPFEVELGLVCGTSTAKLALSKFLPILSYSLLSAFTIMALYKYQPYTPAPTDRIVIPIYVPDNYRLYMAVSFFVTVMFFASLFFFLRVLTRNCYIPIILGVFIHLTAYNFYYSIHNGETSIKGSLIDPFVSAYFLGNEVPNAFAEQYSDLTILKNAWTNNRILFFALSLLLLGATYLLLQREKLHQGFGE